MGTQRVQMKGVLFPCWFVELVMTVQEIFVLPKTLLSAQNKIFFFLLTIRFFYSFIPIAQQAGHWQSCWVACHLICVYVPHARPTPLAGGKETKTTAIVARIGKYTSAVHSPTRPRIFFLQRE